MRSSFVIPLTYIQKGLLFDVFNIGDNVPIYNNGGIMDIKGYIDQDILRRALILSIERSGILGAFIVEKDGEPFIEYGHDDSLVIDSIDFSDAPDPMHEVNYYCRKTIVSSFGDLIKSPLCRFAIIKISESHYALYVKYHQIINDGWGIILHLSNIAECYTAILNGKTDELNPENDYKDFQQVHADYIGSDKFSKDLQFMSSYYSDTPERIFPSKGLNSREDFACREFDYAMPDAFLSRLKDVASASGVSLTNVLYAAVYLTVYKCFGAEKQLYSYINLNRRGHVQKTIVGSFVNVLALKADWGTDCTFQELGAKFGRESMNLMRHTACPSMFVNAELQKIGKKGGHIGEISVNHMTHKLQQKMEGGDICAIYTPSGYSGYPIEILLMEAAEDREVLLRTIKHKHIMSREESLRFDSYLWNLLDIFTAEPDIRCEKAIEMCGTWSPSFPLGTPFEQPEFSIIELNRQKMLGKGEYLELPANETLSSLLESVAAKHSGKTAVTFTGSPYKHLTYAEMIMAANNIADKIRTAGIRRGDAVAVVVERSELLPSIIYGILKTGAAYLPIESSVPPERINFMLKDSLAKICIVSDNTEHLLKNSPIQCLNISNIDISDDIPSSAIDAEPDDVAYIIYTSGSTGTPKGVLLTHRNAISYLFAKLQNPGVTENDRLLSVISYSFDAFVFDMYLPHLAGGGLFIATRDQTLDGDVIICLLDKYDITLFNVTPVTLSTLFECGWQGKKNLRVVSGGDKLSVSLASKIMSTCMELWNLYGPTETSVSSLFHKVNEKDIKNEEIPIGKPIENALLIVADSMQNPIAPNETGELLIGGPGVGKGYTDDTLTREKFINLHYMNGERFYRTGDLVRWNEDGELIFIGRNDSQIKIRGYRIEIGEIEKTIESIDGVREAVVVVINSDGVDQLAAFIRSENEIAESILSKTLAATLPVYMIPSVIRFTDTIPRTISGKTDRNKLKESLTGNDVKTSSNMEKLTETEQKLIIIWEQLLDRKGISKDSDFFGSGGYSLVIVKMINEIKTVFGVILKVKDVFENSALSDLAKIIDDKRSNIMDLGIEQVILVFSQVTGVPADKISNDQHFFNLCKDSYKLSELFDILKDSWCVDIAETLSPDEVSPENILKLIQGGQLIEYESESNALSLEEIEQLKKLLDS